MLALQEAAEAYLVSLYEDTNLCAQFCNLFSYQANVIFHIKGYL